GASKPNAPRHAATAGIRHLVVQPKLSKHLFLGIHFHECFVMAVSVDKRRSVEPRRTKIVGLLFEELTQQERLLAEPFCKRMIGKHVDEFIPKGCGTTWLQNNHWSSGINLRREVLQDFFEMFHGCLQKSGIVQRPAAAHRLRRNMWFEAGRLENTDSRARDLRFEMISKGVRPQKHTAPCAPARPRALLEPGFERLRRKMRDIAVQSNSGGELCE